MALIKVDYEISVKRHILNYQHDLQSLTSNASSEDVRGHRTLRDILLPRLSPHIKTNSIHHPRTGCKRERISGLDSNKFGRQEC